jgi:hypothetical protein
MPDIGRLQKAKQFNVVSVSIIRNWHFTLQILNVQNVRNHVIRFILCIYNKGTLFYLKIDIITFTQTVSCTGKQCSDQRYSYLPCVRVHCLVQGMAVHISFILTAFKEGAGSTSFCPQTWLTSTKHTAYCTCKCHNLSKLIANKQWQLSDEIMPQCFPIPFSFC